MYLVVRGYAKAIYESTLTKQEPPQPIPRFACGKQIYGEVGIIKAHMDSVDPERLVKNVKKELLPRLKQLDPLYLPPVSKRRKPVIITQKSIKMF